MQKDIKKEIEKISKIIGKETGYGKEKSTKTSGQSK